MRTKFFFPCIRTCVWMNGCLFYCQLFSVFLVFVFAWIAYSHKVKNSFLRFLFYICVRLAIYAIYLSFLICANTRKINVFFLIIIYEWEWDSRKCCRNSLVAIVFWFVCLFSSIHTWRLLFYVSLDLQNEVCVCLRVNKHTVYAATCKQFCQPQIKEHCRMSRINCRFILYLLIILFSFSYVTTSLKRRHFRPMRLHGS